MTDPAHTLRTAVAEKMAELSELEQRASQLRQELRETLDALRTALPRTRKPKAVAAKRGRPRKANGRTDPDAEAREAVAAIRRGDL